MSNVVGTRSSMKATGASELSKGFFLRAKSSIPKTHFWRVSMMHLTRYFSPVFNQITVTLYLSISYLKNNIIRNSISWRINVEPPFQPTYPHPAIRPSSSGVQTRLRRCLEAALSPCSHSQCHPTSSSHERPERNAVVITGHALRTYAARSQDRSALLQTLNERTRGNHDGSLPTARR